MPLNNKQKDDVRRIRLGWFYSIDEKGEPLYQVKMDEKPNYDVGQIRKMIFEQLESRGMTIYKVKPPSANCIIRVYRDEKEYSDGTRYRIMGAHCYTKSSDGRWRCIDRLDEEYGLDFSEHKIRTWFFQDEYWDISVDFFDTYVKIVV